MRDEEPDDGRLSRPVLREPEGRNSPRATRHTNLTRALGDLWAVSLFWRNLVVWRSFGLPGQIVCAKTFCKKRRILISYF